MSAQLSYEEEYEESQWSTRGCVWWNNNQIQWHYLHCYRRTTPSSFTQSWCGCPEIWNLPVFLPHKWQFLFRWICFQSSRVPSSNNIEILSHIPLIDNRANQLFFSLSLFRYVLIPFSIRVQFPPKFLGLRENFSGVQFHHLRCSGVVGQCGWTLNFLFIKCFLYFNS